MKEITERMHTLEQTNKGSLAVKTFYDLLQARHKFLE